METSFVLDLPRKGVPVEARRTLAWKGGAELETRLAPETNAPDDPVLRLSGTYRFETVVECARCLGDVQVTVERTFETRLDLAHETSEAMDLEAGEEPATFVRLPEERIDLTAEIVARLELAIPEIVLCSPDCKGLCPVCGANRNTDGCGHAPVPRMVETESLKGA